MPVPDSVIKLGIILLLAPLWWPIAKLFLREFTPFLKSDTGLRPDREQDPLLSEPTDRFGSGARRPRGLSGAAPSGRGTTGIVSRNRRRGA